MSNRRVEEIVGFSTEGEGGAIRVHEEKHLLQVLCLKGTSKQNNRFNDYNWWMGPAAAYFCCVSGNLLYGVSTFLSWSLMLKF